MPGAALVGCSAGFLNVPKIKVSLLRKPSLQLGMPVHYNKDPKQDMTGLDYDYFAVGNPGRGPQSPKDTNKIASSPHEATSGTDGA